MRVLFATYPMAFHTPGGGEVQLLAYRDHLLKMGVEVTLFDPWNPRFQEHDVVHFFSCVGGSVHFCNFVRNLDIPLVISSSLWITEDTKSLYPIDEIRHQLSLADVVVTNSQMESDTLSAVLGLEAGKFSWVHNGVDEVFSVRPSPHLFRQTHRVDKPFVLNVGNIEPRKNQLQLARAMEQHPDLDLILIGHVRDRAYFDQVMATLPAGRVRYLGPLEHHSKLLRSAYQACEVFCLPSTLETPGLAALEAAVQGCRLALTRVGSTMEYFGQDAVYVEPSDITSISDGISRARLTPSHPLEPHFYDRFAWSHVVQKLKAIYEHLG